jgi:flagellar hook-length control protein FliK
VVRELACGQVLVVNILPMMTEEVQMPTEQTIVPETALTAVTLPETPAVQAPAAAEVRPTVQTEQTAELPETVETAAPTAETVAPVTDSTASSQTEERQDLPTDKREDDRTEVVDAEAAPQPLFREVEPHMVKVGETAGTKETEQTADVNRQITDQLTEALETGESKVEIRLTPETLGTVTVEVTQQKDGGLHVSLTAENSHTRALLQQHTASLQELLGSQNQKTVQVEVNRQETRQDFLQDHGQNSQGQGGQQQEQHQRQPQNSQDFLQQLRLGLIPLDVETV